MKNRLVDLNLFHNLAATAAKPQLGIPVKRRRRLID